MTETPTEADDSEPTAETSEDDVGPSAWKRFTAGRRAFLGTTAAGAASLLAGCNDSTDGESGTTSNNSSTLTTTNGGEDSEPASFDVEITETPSPVVEGETLEVTATVTNTGDVEGTQTVTLSDTGFVDSQRDAVEVTLEGGESNTSVALAWETEDGDAGSGGLTVASENDTDTTEVTVSEPDEDEWEPPHTDGPEPPIYDPTGMPQYGAYTHSKIGAGGKTTGIYTCPSNPEVLYQRNDVSGTYRSNDRGESWYMIREGIKARGFSVDPRDEDNVVIAEQHGIYHSSNAVEHYQKKDVTVDDAWSNPVETQWAANGTYRGIGNVVARNPANPDELIAVPIDDNAYRSTDNGESWEQLDGAPSKVYPADVRYDPHNEGTLYLCGGQSTRGTDKDSKSYFQPGFWKSTDGGDSWTQLRDTDMGPKELRFDPDGTRIYAIAGDGDGTFRGTTVWMSEDSGESWSEFANGLPTDEDRVNTIAVNNGAIYVAMYGTFSTNSQLYELQSGGSSWSEYFTAGSDTVDTSNWWDDKGGSPGMAGMAALAFDESQSDTWYLSATYAVYKSEDAGKSWRYSSRGIEEMVGMDVVADFHNDTVHCGIADLEYFRLENNGTKLDIRRKPDIHNTQSIAPSPVTQGKVYAGSAVYGGWPPSGAICYSEDGGDSWTKVNSSDAGLPENPNAPHYYNGGTYAPVGLSAHPTEADHVVAAIGEQSQVYRSTDGGDSWDTVPGTMEGKFWANFWVGNSPVAISGDGSIVVAPNIYGPVQYWDPDTETWSKPDIGSNGDGWDVARDPNTDGRFAVSVINKEGGVFETTDGGQSWSELGPEQSKCVAFDPTDPDRIAYGLENEPNIMLSTDGGDSFQKLPPGMTGGGDHIAFAGDNLVVGAGGSSYFWIDLTEHV